MSGDPDATIRMLRRAVYIHKLFSIDVAWKVLDLHGIPRKRFEEIKE